MLNPDAYKSSNAKIRAWMLEKRLPKLHETNSEKHQENKGLTATTQLGIILNASFCAGIPNDTWLMSGT
jgi:hypothetical protein